MKRTLSDGSDGDKEYTSLEPQSKQPQAKQPQSKLKSVDFNWEFDHKFSDESIESYTSRLNDWRERTSQWNNKIPAINVLQVDVIAEKVFSYLTSFEWNCELIDVCSAFFMTFLPLLQRKYTWIFTPYCLGMILKGPVTFLDGLQSVRIIGNVGLTTCLPKSVTHLQIEMCDSQFYQYNNSIIPEHVSSLYLIHRGKILFLHMLQLWPIKNFITRLVLDGEAFSIKIDGKKECETFKGLFQNLQSLKIVNSEAPQYMKYVEYMPELRELVCVEKYGDDYGDTVVPWQDDDKTLKIIDLPKIFPMKLMHLELSYVANLETKFFQSLPGTLVKLVLFAKNITYSNFKNKSLRYLHIVGRDSVTIEEAFPSTLSTIKIGSMGDISVNHTHGELFGETIRELHIEGNFSHEILFQNLKELRVLNLMIPAYEHMIYFHSDNFIDYLCFPDVFTGIFAETIMPHLRCLQLPMDTSSIIRLTAKNLKQIITRNRFVINTI